MMRKLKLLKKHERTSALFSVCVVPQLPFACAWKNQGYCRYGETNTWILSQEGYLTVARRLQRRGKSVKSNRVPEGRMNFSPRSKGDR